MRDWSNSLRASIDGIEAQLALAIGLTDGLRGDEFEEKLGRFLEFEGLIPMIEGFVPFGGPQPMAVTSDVQQWVSRIKTRSSQIIETVHTSLYDNFNAQRFDRNKTITGPTRLSGESEF
jgi:hypothetical protein